MSLFSADETSPAVFSSEGFSSKESDFLSLPFFVHEKLAILFGSWLVAADTIFFLALDLQVILFVSPGIFLSVFEDIFKKDLLTT